MLGIGLPELLFILVLALLVLGPQRLPEVARMVGRAYAQLRRASEEFQQTIRQDLATIERQEDIQRNQAIAQEIRERLAPPADLQRSVPGPEREPDAFPTGVVEASAAPESVPASVAEPRVQERDGYG